MQQLNVLLAGEKPTEFSFKIQTSKYLQKLYTTYDTEIENAFQIKFNTFKELAEKCKTLKIDLVIAEDEKWILQGIGDVLMANHVNCVAPTSMWTRLGISEEMRRELLEKYEIPLPQKVLIPSEFPVLVRADGISKEADSLTEIIKIKKEIFNTSAEIAQTIYIENILNGEKYTITSLYDGKNLITFPVPEIDENILDEYNTKLEVLLNKEEAKFIGFINSDITVFENKIYNIGFNFRFIEPETQTDLLYILISAMYQKLNEI